MIIAQLKKSEFFKLPFVPNYSVMVIHIHDMVTGNEKFPRFQRHFSRQCRHPWHGIASMY